MDELVSGLGQGVIPGIIIFIYLIVIKWFESKKDTKEQVINKNIHSSISELTDNINDMVTCMKEVSSQLHNVTNNIVERDREKCKMSIELAFNCFTKELCDFAFLTLYNNHVDENADVIKSNAATVINGEYYKVFSIFSLYEINNHKVSKSLKDEWRAEFEEALLAIIFNTKLEPMARMNTLRNKLNIKAKNCSNYVYNNTFN